MNNEPPTVIKGRATYAWLGIVIIIATVAGIGILSEHKETAATLLAAAAICTGLVATVATLQSKKKTGNVLAVTAALSAACGLLVNEADTIQQMISEQDSETVIVAVAIMAIIFLTNAVFQWNRENGETESQPEGTSPGTVTDEESEY